jgi:hypothetical protein
MEETQRAFTEISKQFRRLRNRESEDNIRESKAFSYLLEEISSNNKLEISNEIFRIISVNTFNIKHDVEYFDYIEKILESHDYNPILLYNQIQSMSKFDFEYQLIREKYYYYISLLTPQICVSIFVEREISSIQILLIMIESIFETNQKYLIKSYIYLLIDVLEEYNKNKSKDLIFILSNYANVIRRCKHFFEINSEEYLYFENTSRYYESYLAKRGDESKL